MKGKRPFTFWIYLLLAGASATYLVADKESKGASAFAREDASGNDSLLLIIKAKAAVMEQPQQTSATAGAVIDLNQVDEIRVQVPKDSSKDSAVVILPPGWTSRQEDSELICTGPPLDGKQDVHIRINHTKTKAPKDCKLQIFAKGKKIFDEKLSLLRLPKVQIGRTVKDLLVLSPEMCVGEEIHFQPLDPQRTPLGGQWEFAGVRAVQTGWRYKAQLNGNLKPGDPVSVRYIDPWGELLLDVPNAEGISIIAPSAANGPRINSATPRTFAHTPMCVCGWFPNNAWTGLLMDGKPIEIFLSASCRVVYIVVPPGTQPGLHTISRAGSPDSAQVLILGIDGEIDDDLLWKGQSTPMRLRVLGTQEKVDVYVENRTPGIIDLEGGNVQVISTSGGAENKIERNVRGIQKGNFSIDFKLASDPCPCAGQETTQVQ